MADNTVGAFGLQPLGKVLSKNRYGIVPGATAIYIGDPVKFETTGTTTGLTTVTIATVAAFCGCVLEVFDSTGLPVGYYPAGNATGYTCTVADSPDQEFIVREDSGGGNIAQASLGLNCDLVAGSGSTVTGRSGWQLDSSQVSATETVMVKIVGVYQTPGNVFGNTYCIFVVKANNHQRGSHTGTAGV